MSTFPKLLEEFHEMILEGDAAPMLPVVRKNPRLVPAEQLAIYIDGYRLRLTQAIRSDYPALLAIIGDESFNQLALKFIGNHPPEGYNLDRYPHGFAGFVRDNYDDAFAANMAKLEGAIAEVFIIEESAPLDPASLADLTPEAFGALVLKPRRASRLLAFDYPVNDWLLAQRTQLIPPPAGGRLGGGQSCSADKSEQVSPHPGPPSEGEGNFLYIYRHQNNVQRAALTEPACALLERLFCGIPVGEALDDSCAEHLQAWFAEWMAQGFFSE